MKNSEIIEGNLIIANSDYVPNDYRTKHLEYHKSIDLLLPIANSIMINNENIDTISITLNCGCDIYFHVPENFQVPDDNLDCWTEINETTNATQALFSTIVKFLKYEKQQKK